MSRKNPNTNVVLTRISPGNTPEVLRIARSHPLRVLAIVAVWRALTEVLVRRNELRAAGDLDRRVASRRRDRIELALVRARVRSREPERVRVPVVIGAPAEARSRGVHASVHVGSITGADLDDVGLLEAAMRRAADRRALVTPIDDRSDAHRTDWGGMLEGAGPVERAWRVVEALGALPLLAIVVGVSLTFFPLVRPLHDMAPWMALGGLALAVAGAVGARWADGRAADDDDDGPLVGGR